MRGNSSFDCYVIEARAEFDIKVGDIILTKEWKNIPTIPSNKPIGIGSDLGSHEASINGFLGWNQAKAIEYQLHAELYYKVIGLETRVVQFRGETSYEFNATGKTTPVLKTTFPATNQDLLIEEAKA